jgi:branched-chain amino acid transport system ATP-binding protein
LDEIRKSGVTILLVEQNAYHALAAASFGYVLDLGRVAASGPAASIAVDPVVRKAYLGM